MTIYTQLEDNLEKLKLTAIKEYLPNYLNNNDLSLAEALEQLTAKEITYRTERSAKMSIHIAHFPYDKGLNNFLNFKNKCKHRITTRIYFQLQVSYTDYNKFS